MKCGVWCVENIFLCIIYFYTLFVLQKPHINPGTDCTVIITAYQKPMLKYWPRRDPLQAPSHVKHRGILNINPWLFTYLTTQLNYSIFGALWLPSFLTDCAACSLLMGHLTASPLSVYSCKFYCSRAHSLISNCWAKIEAAPYQSVGLNLKSVIQLQCALLIQFDLVSVSNWTGSIEVVF